MTELTATARTAPHAPARRGHFLTRLFVWLAVLGVFGAAFYFVLTRQAEVKASGRRGVSGAISVVPATAKKADMSEFLDALGTVTPLYTASIVPQVTGVVTDVKFVEGQVVKVGDPLIEIDPRTFEATLQQAQGVLQRDQNLLAQAKMDMDRYQAAWDRKAIAKQQLDDQEKIVLQDQGVVKNDEGVVQFDKLQVEYCHITAPIAGRVGLRLVDPGNLAQASNANTPLAVITQIQPISVIFTIPEDSLSAVLARLHQENTELVVEAYDRGAQKKIATGKLIALDNQIDTTTGTVKARAEFANDDETLFPNQFVNVRLLLRTLQGVTQIPASAVQQNGTQSFVYVVQDETAHVRTVTPGVTNEGQVQVDGVKPDEVVANSSFDKLQDGDKVVLAGSGGGHGGQGQHQGAGAGGQHPHGTGGGQGSGGQHSGGSSGGGSAQ